MPGNGHGFAPPAEVTSDENAWHVKMALPGMEPKDVNVEVTENVLTVTGERKMEEEKTGENRKTEFSYGRFERSFTLPKMVNPDGVTAEFENGMLELHLPLARNYMDSSSRYLFRSAFVVITTLIGATT